MWLCGHDSGHGCVITIVTGRDRWVWLCGHDGCGCVLGSGCGSCVVMSKVIYCYVVSSHFSSILVFLC